MVHQLRRTIKFTNSGKDLDEDRRQMRSLAANRKTEEFKAAYGKTLDINSPEFQSKLSGRRRVISTCLCRSGSHGVRDIWFNSRDRVDTRNVEEFGKQPPAGIEVVLAALREYVASKGDPEQPRLPDAQ